MLNRRLLAVAAIVSTLAACATQPSPASLTETIARTPSLSTLSDLIGKAGLADTLKTGGPFTVFAPTNDAFKAVPAATMEDLGKHPDKLKAVLSYHVLPAKVMAADAKTGNAKTVQGGNVALAKAGEFLTVEDAMVQTPDITATNGVVHIVDRVLTPAK